MTPKNKQLCSIILLFVGLAALFSWTQLRETRIFAAAPATNRSQFGPIVPSKDAGAFRLDNNLYDSLAALTFTQIKKLTASDGEGADQFGWSVAINGNTAIVGGVGIDIGGNADQGSAYIFERNQGGTNNWGQVQKLIASDGASNDVFGLSVGISGDAVVVGAQGDDVGATTDQGSAYVFERNQGGPSNWGQVQKLTASDGGANDEFGSSVSVNNDSIVVGSHFDDVGANLNQGSAYIFNRNQGGANNWGQLLKITTSDGAANDQFGWSINVNNDTLVVGAEGDAIGANSSQGSAYIFDRNQGGADNWGQVQKLVASDGAANDLFGFSVAVENDTAIVGSVFDDVGANVNQGSAYIFYRNQGGADNWGQVQKLTASDGGDSDGMGRSVSVSNDLAIVSTSADDIGANLNQGSAYVFERNAGGANNWGQAQKLTSADGGTGDQFGNSVAISGSTTILGAWADDVGFNDTQGSAYIFEVTPPTAASVSIEGRVLSSGGNGIPNATVYLSDQKGNTRTARSNPFGFYRFDEVEAGQTYIISVFAKVYQFRPRVVNVNDAINDLDFSAEP